jgi:aminoglycoside 3-N-acetyltransferase I
MERTGIMIEIRKLTESDHLEDLIKLSREFFNEYERYHDSFFKIGILKDSDITNYFLKMIKSNDHVVYVTIIDGKIIAYITCYIINQSVYWKVKRVGQISGLMVKKPCRGMGIAKRLLKKANQFFKERGVDYFTVYTAIANEEAIEFYRRRGFEKLGLTMIAEVDNISVKTKLLKDECKE